MKTKMITRLKRTVGGMLLAVGFGGSAVAMSVTALVGGGGPRLNAVMVALGVVTVTGVVTYLSYAWDVAHLEAAAKRKR